MKKARSFLIFIFGFILFVDGIFLLTLKKFHLGTILPLFLGSIICGFYLFRKKIVNFLGPKPKLRILFRVATYSIFIWCFSVIAFFIYLKQNIAPYSTEEPIDAIIVLGSGIINNQPSETLAARLDTASTLAKRQSNSYLVLSGGVGFGKNLSEAEVMSNYLHAKHNISPTRMFLEDKSTSTELNLINSKKILEKQNINNNNPIAIVTSEFHTIRASKIAKKAGYKNFYLVSAPTPLAIRYNGWLREYFAFISGWVLNEY